MLLRLLNYFLLCIWYAHVLYAGVLMAYKDVQ